MSNHTLHENIRTARTDEGRYAILRRWLIAWEDEQTAIVARLSAACDQHRHGELEGSTKSLMHCTDKKFTAARNALSFLGASEQLELTINYQNAMERDIASLFLQAGSATRYDDTARIAERIAASADDYFTSMHLWTRGKYECLYE